MSNKKDLKAYIRYDGTGRVIPGALLLQRFKPKSGGKWHQIGAYECCDPSCLPPVYGEDFIITATTEVVGGLVFAIETNPFTNPTLQVAMVDCDSNPPGRILPLEITLIPGNVYNYFVPDAILDQSCAIAFRRVCEDNKSGWAFGGG